MSDSTARVFIPAFLVIHLVLVVSLWTLHSGALLMYGEYSQQFISLALLSGLLLQCALLIQVVLVARIDFIERYFGHDKMNKVHRTLGYCLLASIVIHPLFLYLGYAHEGGYLHFVTAWPHYGYALVSIALIIVIGVSSLRVIRSRLPYEAWYCIHLLTYPAIALFSVHQMSNPVVSGGIAMVYWLLLNGSVASLFLLYRWVYPLYLSSKHQFVVERLVQEAPGVTSLYVSGKHLETFSYKPGQYLYIRFHDSVHRPWAQKFALIFPHPFSVSKAYDGKSIRFSIKSLGDFTQIVPTLTIGSAVTVTAPLGRFTQDVAVTDMFLLIAGGIGITPLRALAESLNTQNKDTVLLYSARTKADLALVNELKAFEHVRLVCLVSDAAPSDAPLMLSGMLNTERLKELVPDLLDRDAYVCGPPAMMESIVLSLREHGVSSAQIHFEKFAY